MPNRHEIRGKGHQIAGTVKENVGRATGDPILESKGADQRVGGEVLEGVGKAARKVRRAVSAINRKR